jgi:putative BNR repeat neuraminidase
MKANTFSMHIRLLLFVLLGNAALAWAQPKVFERADGYRGIWYYNQPTHDKYVYKYSGGFATYPQQQGPIAIYSAAVQKTFFCYGGTVPGKQELLHMVSYYDHRTGQVPRPVILVNKKTDDAHDNPVMAIDDAGHIWIFSNAHGTSRPSFIWRSVKPYEIDSFELIKTTNFSYGNIHYVPGKGFLFLHTLYRDKGRSLFWSTSPDGTTWSESSLLSRIDMGHYEITARIKDRVVTAFNYHPSPLGLNARTNLYYLETSDMGKTWKTIEQKVVSPPLHDVHNAALVHDFQKEGKLVYLKNIDFDAAGHPVILLLTSKSYESGPAGGVRQWKTVRWTGDHWEFRDFTTSDHNYDYGNLAVEPDGTWRVIAATAPGPQPDTTGGDIVLWTSKDQGQSWKKVKQLTHAKQLNHTYPKRPVNAQTDFYTFWADGDTLKPSESSLYFTDRQGSAVWRLPTKMTSDFAKPEKVE